MIELLGSAENDVVAVFVQVFMGLQTTFAEPMHPSMPKDCFFAPARNSDWSNTLDK